MSLLALQRVTRKFTEPNREETTYDEHWKSDDGGLITCWEIGRKYYLRKSGLAIRAMDGELPSLGWKGGISEVVNIYSTHKDAVKKYKELNCKYGTLYYLAKLQGLLGGDLDITPSRETPLMCTRTGWLVVFTGDSKKYNSQLSAGNALGICHKIGRELRDLNSQLASRAEKGELPELNWPGGAGTLSPPSRQFGSLYYLAQWQGLRGEPWHGITGSNKNMTTTRPVGIKCAASGMVSVFTKDARKYLNKDEIPDIETYPTPRKVGIPENYILKK